MNSTKWINVPNKRINGWVKILSLDKNDSVQFILSGNSYVNQACMTYIGSIQLYESQGIAVFILSGNSYVNQACMTYIGSIQLYESQGIAVIEKLLQSANKGYTQIKYKCTSGNVSVWVSVTEYSRIKFSVLIGKEYETPFILEEPPVDAILVQ